MILGVRGKDHPLTAYRGATVPIALSTDDAGVSRINLTNEYFRAARDYPLGYRDLKQIARTSIEHAFLGDAAKGEVFKRLDETSDTFEREVVARGSLFGNVWGWSRTGSASLEENNRNHVADPRVRDTEKFARQCHGAALRALPARLSRKNMQTASASGQAIAMPSRLMRASSAHGVSIGPAMSTRNGRPGR